MSKLFSPCEIADLSLSNRIVIPPMCQYSASEGNATDWHMIHLGNLALSGAGLLILEATAVEPAGRISHFDLGLWSDENEQALGRVLASVRTWSDMPIGIQLAHAGRKASVDRPWAGGAQLPLDQGGWDAVGPSGVGFESYPRAPLELSHGDLDRLLEAYVATARRSLRLGIDLIELHCAHGYLLHQFLSPLSNRRDDRYGGSLENRMRFPLAVYDAIRAVLPAGYPLGVRISGTDWVEGGWDIEQSIVFATALRERGIDFIDMSSGGMSTTQRIPLAPNYQVPLARAVREATGVVTMAVGLITEPEQAEAIVATGEADLVGVARGMIYDPRWPWHAAARLGARVKAAPQFLRAQPRQFKELFL